MDKLPESGNEFLKTYGKKIAIGAAVVSAGIALYFFFSKKSTKSPPSVGADDSKYTVLIKALRKMVEEEQPKGELGINTLMLIHEALMLVTRDKYGELVARNRRERRRYKDTDLSKYENIVIDGAEETEELINDMVRQVAKDCNCPIELYETSVEHLAQTNPQFAMMSVLMIEKMKIYIPQEMEGRPPLTEEELKAILKFSIEEYPKIEVEPSNPEIYGLLKQSLLSDLTYERFNFEEEDMIRCTSDRKMANNMEIQAFGQQLQTMIQTDIMAHSGNMIL